MAACSARISLRKMKNRNSWVSEAVSTRANQVVQTVHLLPTLLKTTMLDILSEQCHRHWPLPTRSGKHLHLLPSGRHRSITFHCLQPPRYVPLLTCLRGQRNQSVVQLLLVSCHQCLRPQYTSSLMPTNPNLSRNRHCWFVRVWTRESLLLLRYTFEVVS